MIHFECLGRWYDVKVLKFSGGELHMAMQDRTGLWPKPANGPIKVATRIQSSDDLMELILLTELLRRESNGIRYELTIPYFPYARQDRVTDELTGFTLKTVANIINDLKYDKLVIYDPHSDVTPALLNNVQVINQADIVTKLFRGLDEYIRTIRPVIVAPDAGAVKKAAKIATHYKLPLVSAEKVRNTTTGDIIETRFHCDINFADKRRPQFLIVDDICDGGRTFIELAKAMRQLYKNAGIALYVTHGIFSKKFESFIDHIDRIYCTDTFIPQHFPIGDKEPPLFIGQVTPEPLWRKL